MDDTTFVSEVQTTEQVEVNVQEEVRVEDAIDKGEEDARKVDEGKDKDDNPLVDADNPPILEREADTKKDVEKEKVEVKVEVEFEARDITKLVKGKQIIDDPEFLQGPINLTSLSRIQKLQFTSFSQEKASEDLLKSLTEYNMLLALASKVFEKLMPSFQKDSFDSPYSQLKSMINSVDTYFESFEKSVEEKVRNEFDTKRLQTLKKMIENDSHIRCLCKEYARSTIQRWKLV